MLTNARSALNTLKTSGQRIYVELEGTYRLLTMPSMFEIGFNYARWYLQNGRRHAYDYELYDGRHA